jgi:hypothetical protein
MVSHPILSHIKKGMVWIPFASKVFRPRGTKEHDRAVSFIFDDQSIGWGLKGVDVAY